MSEEERKKQIISLPSIQTPLESSCFIEGAWPNKNWWELFCSPVLNKWIQQALCQNPSLIAAKYRIELAKQQSAVARAKLMPTLFFNADDQLSYFSKNGLTHALNPNLGLAGYQIELGLSFQYEFDFWDQNRNLFRAALGEMKVKEAEFHQTELILASSLSQSYFALAICLEKKKLYQSLVHIRKERFNLNQQLLDGALVSRLPLLEEDSRVQESIEMLLSIEDELATQTYIIASLLGQGPEDYFEPPLPPQEAQAILLPKDLSIELLSRRPDLSALLWKVTALSHEISAAKADFFPNINLVALAGLQTISLSNLFSLSSKTAGIKPALSLPIFTAGSIRANLRAKKAAFDAAVFEYNHLILKSAQEVATLLKSAQIVYEQKEKESRIVQDAEERLDLVYLRVLGGLDSRLTELDFEETVVFKKIQDLSLLYLQYAFAIKIIQALGGGYQS